MGFRGVFVSMMGLLVMVRRGWVVDAAFTVPDGLGGHSEHALSYLGDAERKEAETCCI
jgi:hypothetical protein